MPPASSQKGTGKKGAGAIARQRSRNTTPSTSSVPLQASLPPVENKQTEYLDLNYETFRNITYEDLVDQNASGSHMPESKSLDGIMTRFQRLQDTLEKRSTFCDRGMRLLVSALRARQDEAAAERSREEERQRAEDDERARKANKANKANKKKRKAADTLAPPDSNIGQSDSTNLCQHYLISRSMKAAKCTSGNTVLFFASIAFLSFVLPLCAFIAAINPSRKIKLKSDELTTNHPQNVRLHRATLTNREKSRATTTQLHLLFRLSLLLLLAPWTSTKRSRSRPKPTTMTIQIPVPTMALLLLPESRKPTPSERIPQHFQTLQYTKLQK